MASQDKKTLDFDSENNTALKYDQDQNDTAQQTLTCSNARKYAQTLRPWLNEYYTLNAMQSFAANCAMQMQTMSHFAYMNTLNNNYCSAPLSSHIRSRQDPYASRRIPHGEHQGAVPQHTTHGANPAGGGDQAVQGQGVVVHVPTFWKRVAAELVDFTFLFYIKMTVSFFLMTEFSLDQLSFFASDDIFDSFQDLDYNRAFAITFEVIALEIINRILITFFETMCIYRTMGNGVAIGATPGKRLLGLKVVSCESMYVTNQGQVIVNPAGNVSFKNAFLRSVIKNFTIAFFLPACLTIFFFHQNRTAYDVVAHTIVVEDVD